MQTHAQGLSLNAICLPRVANVAADLLSKGVEGSPADWVQSRDALVVAHVAPISDCRIPSEGRNMGLQPIISWFWKRSGVPSGHRPHGPRRGTCSSWCRMCQSLLLSLCPVGGRSAVPQTNNSSLLCQHLAHWAYTGDPYCCVLT